MLRQLGDSPQWYCGWDCILMPRAPGSNPSQGTRILQEVQQGKTKQNKKNLNYSLYVKSNAHDKMFKILLRLEIALYVCAQLCPIFCNHRDYIAHQAPLSMHWTDQLVSYSGAQISLWVRITGGREDGEGFWFASVYYCTGGRGEPLFPSMLLYLFRLSAPWGQRHLHNSLFPQEPRTQTGTW